MDARQQRVQRAATAQRAAVGLGWFSIGLGIAELVFANALARALGMRGQENLIRFYGMREVATGIGILTAKDREPWLWGRVAGDALDVATLAAHAERNPKTQNLAIAFGAVAGATALDVVTAQQLRVAKAPLPAPRPDYSDRSGFPLGAEAARGAARRDFVTPEDMRTPKAMRMPEGARPQLH